MLGIVRAQGGELFAGILPAFELRKRLSVKKASVAGAAMARILDQELVKGPTGVGPMPAAIGFGRFGKLLLGHIGPHLHRAAEAGCV
jgi:hypothetical protein